MKMTIFFNSAIDYMHKFMEVTTVQNTGSLSSALSSCRKASKNESIDNKCFCDLVI